MPDTREVGGWEGAEGGGGHGRRTRLWVVSGGGKTWGGGEVGGEVVEGRLENTGPARTSGDKVSAVHTHHDCLCKVCFPAVRPAGPPSVDDDAGVKFGVSAGRFCLTGPRHVHSAKVHAAVATAVTSLPVAVITRPEVMCVVRDEVKREKPRCSGQCKQTRFVQLRSIRRRSGDRGERRSRRKE